MYEERKEKFSFKSFFLTLLLVVLFILLILFLFPTRWEYKDLQSAHDINELATIYDEIFANNVSRMKDAAIGYFTNERLPKKVGDSKKLTLQEMYDLHLILKLRDKDGNECDVNKSYVQMTKYDEEYRLKVNLSCGEQEDYIIVYLGCYSYCSGGICEKVVSNNTSKPSEEDTNKENPDKEDTTPEEPEDEEPTPNEPEKPTKKYMYEYKLVVDGSTNYSDWSEWQKDLIEATDAREVETKTEQKLTGYETSKVQTGTKVETIVKKVSEKYISGYTTKLVVTGTKEIKVGTTTKTTTEKVAIGTVEKFVGISSGTKVPTSTSTTIYKVVSNDTPTSCSYCENEKLYIWEIYNVETVYDVVKKTETVPVYKTVNVYEEQQIPVYDYRIVEKEEKVETPVYKEVNVPQYETVTYYRYRTKTVIKGYTDIKWSYSKTDSSLTNKGYKLTGNSKEV